MFYPEDCECVDTKPISIQKSSANTALTVGNSGYSLAGAVYGIYKTSADADANKNVLETIITNASGTATTSGKYSPGTYYIKELTASKGYLLDSTVHTVTLSENGTVTRGVCEVKDGYLSGVTEHYNLDKSTDLPMNTKVSMNIWGFYPDIFARLEEGFEKFLSELKDPMKQEYILPMFVDGIIKNENAKIKVLTTKDSWIGMTYREDLDYVRKAVAKLNYDF